MVSYSYTSKYSHECIISLLHILIIAVYPDGRVCISILHTPGDDPMGYELPIERWSPVQSVEKVLLSVVSMLAGERHCLLIHMAVSTLAIGHAWYKCPPYPIPPL